MGQNEKRAAGFLDAGRLADVLDVIAEELGTDVPLTQVLALLRTAHEGGTVDQGKLAEVVGVSPANMSRTVRVLSREGRRDQDTPGKDMIEFVLDPSDNRRRQVRLNLSGEKLMMAVLRKFREVCNR